MQSATSRLNSIVMFGGTLLLVMSLVNHFHGRFLYDPKPDIQFEITAITSFREARQWDALSFKYNLNAGTCL